MKRYLLIGSLLCAAVLSVGALTTRAQAEKKQTQQAVVTIDETIKLRDIILRGEYLFVHDEEKMARGEACTSVYERGSNGKYDKLVTSFHCVPVAREQVKVFTIAVSPTSAAGMPEMLEYQFAGTTEGHRVPRS